jgi:transcription elongation factor SPT6
MSVELSDSMSLLELHEYAEDLLVNGKGKRKLQLEHIKEELRYPWLDLRKTLISPNDDEMFSIITGENDYTLYVGLKVGCTITKIVDQYDNVRGKRKQFAYTRTDDGLKGSISIYDLVDDRIDDDKVNISDYLSLGQHVYAVVVGVNKFRFTVELSIRPSHVLSTEDYWMTHRVADQAGYYDDGKPRYDPDSKFDKYALKW